MAFQTYQCEQYTKYLVEHPAILEKVYDLIKTSPYTTTDLGAVLGYDYYKMARQIRLRKLTTTELIKVLQYIK